VVTCSISEVEAYADTLLRYGEAQDQQALTNELEQAVAKAEKDLHEPYEVEAAMYEELGPTKDVSFAIGCCGHIVHPEDAGQLCGSCLCK
jgi:hypothetical protein